MKAELLTLLLMSQSQPPIDIPQFDGENIEQHRQEMFEYNRAYNFRQNLERELVESDLESTFNSDGGYNEQQ